MLKREVKVLSTVVLTTLVMVFTDVVVGLPMLLKVRTLKVKVSGSVMTFVARLLKRLFPRPPAASPTTAAALAEASSTAPRKQR